MKFRSPTETPIRVALTSGHGAIIGPEWRDLPAMLHREALAAGAQCDANFIENKDAAPVQASESGIKGLPDEDSAYRDAILTLIQREQDGDFVASTGMPNLKAVEKLTGFRVQKERVYAVFRALSDEAKA